MSHATHLLPSVPIPSSPLAPFPPTPPPKPPPPRPAVLHKPSPSTSKPLPRTPVGTPKEKTLSPSAHLALMHGRISSPLYTTLPAPTPSFPQPPPLPRVKNGRELRRLAMEMLGELEKMDVEVREGTERVREGVREVREMVKRAEREARGACSHGGEEGWAIGLDAM